MWLFLSIYPLGILACLFHIWKLTPIERNKAKIVELLLLYQIVFSLGLTSLLAFIGLTIMPDYIAAYTGWPACPFEQQLANVNLAFGILGILAIWLRGGFWIATVLGFSIWIVGDGLHHLYEFMVLHNDNAGNIGVPLYTDFAIPILLLILLGWHINALPGRPNTSSKNN